MKKTIKNLAALVFVFCVFQLRAQDEEKPRIPIRFELGLNTSSLFDRLTRKSIDSAYKSPYLLQFRVSRAKLGMKIAAGGTYNKDRIAERGFLDSNTALKEQVDLRVGFDYRLYMGRRADITFGLDGLWSFSKTETIADSGFDVERKVEQAEYFGGGPTIGMHFWLTKRLAIYTEMGLYFRSGNTEKGRFFQNFPELNDNIQDTEHTELQTLLPTNLYLVYRF